MILALTALVACGTPKGVVLSADSLAIESSGRRSEVEKIVMVGPNVAVATIGSADVVTPAQKYHYRDWMGDLGKALPPRPSASAVASGIRKKALATLQGIGPIRFVIAGLDRKKPRILMVTVDSDGQVTQKDLYPNGQALFILELGFSARRDPDLRKAKTLDRLAQAAGTLIAIEAQQNDTVGKPIQQVIIRASGPISLRTFSE